MGFNIYTAIADDVKERLESGIGIALVMEFFCNQDTLCLRPFEPEIESGCVLVWKKNLTLSPAVRRFIEYIKENLERV